jgi:hypothetical protein
MRLLEPHSGAAAVLGDEFDAGQLQSRRMFSAVFGPVTKF